MDIFGVQLIHIMDNSRLAPNEETHKHLRSGLCVQQSHQPGVPIVVADVVSGVRHGPQQPSDFALTRTMRSSPQGAAPLASPQQRRLQPCCCTRD